MNRIKIVNWTKEYENYVPKSRFSFKRYWSGKLWYIGVSHYTLILDFRKNWMDDMRATPRDDI